MPVEGVTWMDHEFFTGTTPVEGVGWDWFSIRLDDGRDVMLYTVRHPDGERYRFGTLVEADGRSRPLDLDGLQTEALEHWTSPDTRTRYPIAWRIELPAEDLRLMARATVAAQEMNAAQSVGFAYWEGLTDFEGTFGNQPVRGEGYVELTGY
jgi:predicted secreted hydrolase